MNSLSLLFLLVHSFVGSSEGLLFLLFLLMKGG